MSWDLIAQIMVPFTGCIACYLAASQDAYRRMWAGIFGLLGEPFWFITAYINGQWGIIILVFVYGALWFNVVVRNYKAHYES